MKILKVPDLFEGAITAQHILDFENRILLAAGTMLTNRHIRTLKLWDVRDIRIREAEDTDQDIKKAIELDYLSGECRRYAGSVKDLEDYALGQLVVTGVPASIIKTDSLSHYTDIAVGCSKFIQEVKETRSVSTDILNRMAHVVTRYTTNTIGAIAYSLQTLPINKSEVDRHSLAVAVIAAKIALLLGYDQAEVKTIAQGALIHDIGRFLLPPDVLQRKGRLTPEDEVVYRSHVSLGYKIIKDKKWFPKDVSLILAQHHERLDGSGFPLGVSGKKIHFYAQIVAMADAFDSMVHDSSYSENLFNIRDEILMQTIGKLDSKIVECFISYLDNFLHVANVRLTDGRKAEVIYLHQLYRSPVVRTFDGEIINLNQTKAIKISGNLLNE